MFKHISKYRFRFLLDLEKSDVRRQKSDGSKGVRRVWSYVFMPLWDGLHQVHALSVHLNERQNVPVPDGLIQNLQHGFVVAAQPLGEAFLRVLGRDVVLPGLPGITEEPSSRRSHGNKQPPHQTPVPPDRHLHVTAWFWFGHVLSQQVRLHDLVEVGVSHILRQLKSEKHSVTSSWSI